MSDITIPPEAVEAAAAEYLKFGWRNARIPTARA